MGVGEIFDIGKSGLTANQIALQTASNNIANAATPGYSRQRASLQARSVGVKDGVMLGGGVDIQTTLRVHDDFVERQIMEEAKNYGTVKTRSESLRHLESLLHTNGFELGELTNKFYNSYRELSANPENSAIRSEVAETAKAVASNFRKTDSSLHEMKRDIDLKLEYMVGDINTKTKELAILNEQIARSSYVNEPANELEDRRDMIVRDLSQKLGFPIVTDERRQFNISSTGLGILVQGSESNQLVVMRTAGRDGKAAGDVDIFVKDNFGTHSITGAIKEGELSGLLHVRDNIINPTLKQLDSTAFQFANSVNDAHKEGVGIDGKSDRGLFHGTEELAGSSSRIDVSDAVKNSYDVIASGLSPSAPGDNRIALKIADLQNKALMPSNVEVKEGAELENNHFTINEALNSIMGNVASHTAREEQLSKHQEMILGQLDNYKQSISGVSLEEEAVKMIQHQAVFNASAKTMKLGDELLQTILHLKE